MLNRGHQTREGLWKYFSTGQEANLEESNANSWIFMPKLMHRSTGLIVYIADVL